MKLTFIIISMLLVTSCRTASRSFSREMELNHETFERLNFQQHTNTSRIDSILSQYKASIKRIERQYTPPDSTGNQSLISETEYDIELEGKNLSVTNGNKNTDTDLANDRSNTKNDKLIENEIKETDNRLFKPPQWMIILFLIIIIIGIIYKCRKMIVHKTEPPSL